MEVDDVLPGGHGHQIYPDISRYGMDNISKAGKMMEKSAPSVKAQMVKGLALPSVKVPAAVLVAFSNRCGKFHRLLPVFQVLVARLLDTSSPLFASFHTGLIL